MEWSPPSHAPHNNTQCAKVQLLPKNAHIIRCANLLVSYVQSCPPQQFFPFILLVESNEISVQQPEVFPCARIYTAACTYLCSISHKFTDKTHADPDRLTSVAVLKSQHTGCHDKEPRMCFYVRRRAGWRMHRAWPCCCRAWAHQETLSGHGGAATPGGSRWTVMAA